jgi:drug/metabolite transporter (DMT)-like permease
MTGFAFALVLAAAFVHATWNFLAKRVGGGPPFLWLFALLSAVIYLPLAVLIIVIQKPFFGVSELMVIIGSSLIHLLYFLTLQKGYQVGDLSVVYPLARGTGPTLSTLAAVLFLGERPSYVAMSGALFVVIGVFLLAGGEGFSVKKGLVKGVGFGVLTGMLIASYTLWDKHAVSRLFIPPLLMDYCSTLGRILFLSPVALHRRNEVLKIWSSHKWETIGVAALNPLSYILVLTALVKTPVSYIAPLREMSILIGTVMGARLLAEEGARKRLLAAGMMLLGISALAIG